MTDPAGLIRRLNGPAHAMFGYAAAELGGRPVSMLDQMALPLGVDEEFTRSVATNGVWEGYSAGRRRDGSSFPVTIAVIPLGELRAPPCGYLVTYRGVDERLEVVGDLRAALHLANSARQTRRIILNSVTHEFRTPLAAIIGFADLLDGMQTLPPLAHNFAGGIRLSAQRLSALVETVIEYARVQAGQGLLQPDAYRVRPRLAQFVEPFVQQLRPANVEWRLAVDPEVPEQITVDGQKLERILAVLLDNARKFTSAGHINLTVAPSAAVPDMVEFRVEDTGVGYDPSLADRLFEPFRQAEEGLDRSYSGIGLGLALARQLSDLLEGTLSATTAPGKGSTFVLSIPVRPSYAAAAGAV